MSRIILKLSGEALAGPKSMGFDENTVRGVAVQVRQLVEAGVNGNKVIVIGTGNPYELTDQMVEQYFELYKKLAE